MSMLDNIPKSVKSIYTRPETDGTYIGNSEILTFVPNNNKLVESKIIEGIHDVFCMAIVIFPNSSSSFVV